MPRHEIIDLSLSTDDENQSKTCPASKNSHRGALPAADGFIPIFDDIEYDPPSEQAPKRRRLSPPVGNGPKQPKKQPVSYAATISTNASSTSFGGPRNTKRSTIESDPIFFTSSPRAPSNTFQQPTRATGSVSPFRNLSDDDGFPEDPYTTFSQKPVEKSRLTDRTTALLAEISGNANTKRRSASASKSKLDRGATEPKGKITKERAKCTPETTISKSHKEPGATKRTRLTSTERELKEQEKEQAKIQKAREKEDEKERKRILREEKVREKQVAADLAEVNKARTDKKISTPEMIVDLPASIQDQSVETQIRAFLKDLQVETAMYDCPLPNIIKWRRKVDSSFNEELGHWERVPPAIHEEKHVMCLVSAKEFVSMAVWKPEDTDGQDLDAHVLQLKTRYPGSISIYLIEGLEVWMRKNKNTRNRAYQAAVNRQLDSQNVPPSSRRKKQAEECIDENIVEDALLRLQVQHNCLIHHTNATVETAEWVAVFTQHISTIPYK
ncbi:MAG: hypothetical protein Q9187_003575 [Circinaria calcarea]